MLESESIPVFLKTVYMEAVSSSLCGKPSEGRSSVLGIRHSTVDFARLLANAIKGADIMP